MKQFKDDGRQPARPEDAARRDDEPAERRRHPEVRGVKQWANFQVSHQVGNDWALGGALTAIAGLAGSLFIQRRRVWVRAVRGARRPYGRGDGRARPQRVRPAPRGAGRPGGTSSRPTRRPPSGRDRRRGPASAEPPGRPPILPKPRRRSRPVNLLAAAPNENLAEISNYPDLLGDGRLHPRLLRLHRRVGLRQPQQGGPYRRRADGSKRRGEAADRGPGAGVSVRTKDGGRRHRGAGGPRRQGRHPLRGRPPRRPARRPRARRAATSRATSTGGSPSR